MVELVPGLTSDVHRVEVRHEGCLGGWPMVAQLLNKALEAVLPQAFAEVLGQTEQRVMIPDGMHLHR